MLEASIRFALDKLSNDEGDDLVVDDAWIEEAGEQFKDTLRRQFRRQPEEFRLRMSNIGRPVCQLQMAKSGAKAKRKPYNHIVRMIHGDIFECVMDVILKIAKANITGGKNKVQLDLAGQTIKGEDDIHIDDMVWDIKSASPWAYDNKWSRGYAGLKQEDSFGYVGQLVGYAKAQGKKPGGWIVGNKSTGEIMVVEMSATPNEIDHILMEMEHTVSTVANDKPLERQFEPQPDTFRGVPTGLRRLDPKTCGFCDFVQSCWPNAVYKAQPSSTAKSPPYYWYIKE